MIAGEAVSLADSCRYRTVDTAAGKITTDMAPGRKPAACCGRTPATPVTTRKIIVTPQDGSRRQQPHTRDDDRGLPPAQSTVMPAVPPAAIGKASGTFNTLRQLGGVFGVAIGAATFAARGGYASPAAFTAGLGPATGVCAGPALAGAVAGLGTASRGRRAPSSQSVPHPIQAAAVAPAARTVPDDQRNENLQPM